MRACKMGVCILTVMLCMGLWSAPWALAEEKPRYGGILQVALAGDLPNLDMHQETTFMVIHPMSPAYNTLIHFDPHNYPQIAGDLAKSWTVSDDYLTSTFTLHEGVKFHLLGDAQGPAISGLLGGRNADEAHDDEQSDEQ